MLIIRADILKKKKISDSLAFSENAAAQAINSLVRMLPTVAGMARRGLDGPVSLHYAAIRLRPSRPAHFAR